MGLGKTVQTIGLLAYLAATRGYWGPHLIVAPSSCIVNWESEIKKFCPAFKVLCYFGSAKYRKMLRSGWSKTNSFHVCITSYQLIVQDANVFKRKKWYYLILDEAHNIKNFKSKRWQTLLRFNAYRRLMLTGTPLQNNLIELWSLMHFLMPTLFASRKEFSYWFNNPLTNSIENSKKVKPEVIDRLHEIIRPFILRRLKKDVAKQLPPKHEHLVPCKMSKRQTHLYEEFISRSNVKASLASGSYIGMMNALMQLRKICNHPDLVEPRPVLSPIILPPISIELPKLILRDLGHRVQERVSRFYIDLWADDINLSFPYSHLSRQLFARPESPTNTQCLRLTEFCSWISTSSHRREERVAALSTLKSILDGWKIRMPSLSMLRCHRMKNSDGEHLVFNSLHWKFRLSTELFVIHSFVFVLPKIVTETPTLPPTVKTTTSYPARLLSGYNLVQDALTPFHPVQLQQTLSYPNKKLVQYDCGKLQTLATLLRNLKRNKHKCLIFTQMTKMLDILEVFLNLNSFSYLRLDGSTSIEDRQQLMDRFNLDEKIFCFILSTRSGGLGINLVGADTVIFYDTDWNPTVDAQAQDRAHRIGQLKEVNIYRLVSQSTVEENILHKAQQKRKLDSIVMNEGNFSESSLLTVGSLQGIFGLEENLTNVSQNDQEQVDIMNELEDEEDRVAMQNLRSEIDNDLRECNDDGGDEKDLSSSGANKSSEFVEDTSILPSLLKPVDQYAMNVQLKLEPGVYHLHEIEGEIKSVEGDAIQSSVEIEDEVIVAKLSSHIPLSSKKSWYLSVRKDRQRQRLLKSISGDSWSKIVVDGVPYWENSDTGEISFETPSIIRERDVYANAKALKFNYLPESVMISIFTYLVSFPDRMNAAQTCARWHRIASRDSFSLRVFPSDRNNNSVIEPNRQNTFSSLGLAIAAAHPGDTIVLRNGHHWEKDLTFIHPVKICCENIQDPSCVIELMGRLNIENTKVIFIGVSFRAHKIDSTFRCQSSALSVIFLF